MPTTVLTYEDLQEAAALWVALKVLRSDSLANPGFEPCIPGDVIFEYDVEGEEVTGVRALVDLLPIHRAPAAGGPA